MIARNPFPLILFLPCLSHAGPQVINLCHADEQVVFSCPVHRVSYVDPDAYSKQFHHAPAYQRLKIEKIISVCATKPITPESGQLWYRFGSPNRAPDFEYPKKDQTKFAEFVVKNESWAKGYDRSISFKAEEFQYRVYMRYAVFAANYRSNGSGVEIAQADKKITDYWCDGSAIKKTKSYTDQSYQILINPSGTDFEEKPKAFQ